MPLASCQLDAFALPQVPRYAPKPTVPPEFRSYFELDGHAAQLMDTLMGPRPGGLFPEKTYEIGNGESQATGNNQPVHVPGQLERTLESFFTAPENAGQVFPPGFNSGGFSLQQNSNNIASFGQVRRAPQKSAEVEGSGEASESSIGGIPKIFPKLPKSPYDSHAANPPAAVSSGQTPYFPQIQSAPDVPEGGFIPTSEIRRAPQSVSGVASSIDDVPDGINNEEYGGLAEETSTSSGGLIGTILNMIGLGSKKAAEMAKKNTTEVSNEDRTALGRAMSNLIGGENSPLPGKSMISNVLYKALTAGTVQNNETTTENNGTIVLSPAQSAAITENLELVKNLIIQPSSPLCTQKPVPVDFDLEAILGQWYQVVYSPPLSSGPCSMVAYKKLSSLNDGGVGSMFEIFEYTTDGTPYGKPKITSGYAIVKEPGELIYRTTSNQEDVVVHVLHVGPTNENNEYEYVIMSTNCNFPLYVFARDPVTYKQRYETDVNRFMEQKGLVNGFSRLLNIVAPVDNSMCTFPPSLFNIAG